MRDEEGATLIIAMIVMTLLVTLTLALQARTLSTLKFMRKGQDYEAALAAADAGLADAVFRIEQTVPNDFTRGVSPDVPITVGSGTYKYKADKRSETTYWVHSTGTVGKSTKAVTARVQRTSQFPYALFGFESLTMDGSSVPFAGINLYVVGAVGAPVQVGSNGQVLCEGQQAANLTFKSFGGFSGCPASQWTALQEKHPMLTINPPPEPKRQGANACRPSSSSPDGVFTGTIDGGGGLAYVCQTNVVFTGVVGVVNGPLIVYIINDTNPSASDPNAGCNTLDISTAVINAGQPARNVQIFKEGSCGIDIGSGNTSDQLTFSGVLYAPKETLVINGGKWFTGSINVANIVVNGTPNLVIGYDGDLSTYYSKKWRVSRYAEVEPTYTLPP